MAKGNDVESNRNYKLHFMKSIQTGDTQYEKNRIKRIRSSFLKNFLGMKWN